MLEWNNGMKIFFLDMSHFSGMFLKCERMIINFVDVGNFCEIYGSIRKVFSGKNNFLDGNFKKFLAQHL